MEWELMGWFLAMANRGALRRVVERLWITGIADVDFLKSETENLWISLATPSERAEMQRLSYPHFALFAGLSQI
jgi:hypothetical protein